MPDSNFEIEFLCPLVVGDPDRYGKRQLVKEVQSGLMARPLRYLDLALSVENIILYNEKKTNYSNVKSFKIDFLNYFEDKKSVGITKVMQELKDRGISDINEYDVIATFQDFFKLLKI